METMQQLDRFRRDAKLGMRVNLSSRRGFTVTIVDAAKREYEGQAKNFPEAAHAAIDCYMRNRPRGALS